MIKVLGKCIIAITVILLLAYGYLYWKIHHSIQTVFNNAQLLAEADYDSFTFDPSGSVALEGIRIRFPSSSITISMQRVSFTTNNLWELLNLERAFSTYKIPHHAEIKISQLRVPLTDSFIRITSPLTESDRLSQLALLACHVEKTSFFQRLRDMGYAELVSDIDIGYNFDYGSGELDAYWLTHFRNLANVEFYGKYANAYPIMEDVRLVAEPGNAYDTVRYWQQDLGYNQRFVRSCAEAQKIPEKQWLTEHQTALFTALNTLDITINDEIKAAYKDYLKPGTELSVSFTPPTGATFESMGWYDPDVVPGLMGINVVLNKKSIPVTLLGWNPSKWSDPALQLNGRGKNTKTLTTTTPKKSAPRKKAGKAQTSKEKPYIRRLRKTSLATLHTFTGHTVEIQRNDGKKFAGVLERFDGRSYWIKVVSGAGTATLPVDKTQIKSIAVVR